ncbi:tRNA (adenosine(37)-N6)-threonylcarbamoyltransferase complex dimerization subunit type 1 TsaB [Patescibacteria group bacterium]|nr:tRNA (adenosine(37)-N6)-threonylcarbamoyltransferase complex dimerization subunit type 1 TsaB [Patescibacteria group bacterium]
MQLFLDTSTQTTVVALVRKGEVIFYQKSHTQMKHSELLLSKIELALKKARVKKEALEEIVVIKGPGSYTGLRVGLAVANALAFGLGIKLCGLTKFDVAEIYLENNKEPNTIIALPAFRDHFMKSEKGQLSIVPVKDILRGNSSNLLLMDLSQDEAQKLGFKKEQLFDYQKKLSLSLWSKASAGKFTKRELVPFYFQAPKTT